VVSRPGRNRPPATQVIRFIERLIVPSGLGAGGPLRPRPWQQAFFRDAYEPKQRGGRRVVRRAGGGALMGFVRGILNRLTSADAGQSPVNQGA
jgi:hypothetical protein